MLNISNRNLKIISAFIWYIGGIVLIIKGSSLLLEAEKLDPKQLWPWIAIITGLFIGSLKAWFLFSKSCQKNLNRIDALKQPKIWQFFRPIFLLFLIIMIMTGATLSKLAHNNYPLLIAVALLDFSIAMALLGSSIVFWKKRIFRK